MANSKALSIPELSSLLLSTLEEGRDGAVLVAIAHPDPRRIGSRVLVRDNELCGTFLDPEADAGALKLGLRGLQGDPQVEPGLYPLPLRDGEEMTVFLELHHPSDEMVLVGAGHVGQPLCTLGALLGLRVRVLDDRSEFATMERFPEAAEVRKVDFRDPFRDIPLHPWSHVVLVTRGHRYDYECLRQVLICDPLPAYIGMIGSRRRVRATFDALLAEGFSHEILARVHAPIGLDLGAETPAEIAVSVAAEMVHLWRGGSGRPLRETESILARFHPLESAEGRPNPEEDHP
ncbi:XdhC family protein [Gemmatimonadota bacterium]